MHTEAHQLIQNAKKNGATSLYLNNPKLNDRTLPRELWELNDLRELYLAGISISNLDGIQHLIRLESLNLERTKITFESLFRKKRLFKKFLSRSENADNVSVFQPLTQLKRLYLSENNLTNISFLEDLPQLQVLTLRRNKITDITIIKHLIQIRELDLGWNRITDFSGVKNLSHLRKLSLGWNNSEDISAIKNLTSLKILHLNDMGINDISSLKGLTKLQELKLGGNPSIEDISTLKNLKELKELDLHGNNVSDISVLRHLKKVQVLNLLGNKVTSLSVFQHLRSLKELRLSHNNLSNISGLQYVPQLQFLQLSGMDITDISVLENLPRLRELDLSSNKITNIKALLPLIRKGLKVSLKENDTYKKINLYDNPLQHPPIEVIMQGNKAIINYFEVLESDEEVIVYEAKLLVIGEAGVGKTTFAHKLINSEADMPDEIEDTTKGINVLPYVFEGHGPHPNFLTNIWDFGGQAIYHSTHQFFLSKRSLYVLLLDGRIEENPHYWLQAQDLLGGESPLIMVMNKKGSIRQQPSLTELRQYYKNFRDFKELNLKNDKNTIQILRSNIEHYLRHLPQFEKGERLPGKWVSIRRRLQASEENYIPLKEYRKLCREEGIIGSRKQDFLSDYLHDLGAMLHFIDEPLLKKIVILKPQWATEAVYKVLDHTKAQKRIGHFEKKDLDRVWTGLEYADVFDELLALMEKFELCYQVPNTQTFIVPQLLPEDKPPYVWTDHEQLQLQYRYDFLPKGIVTRVIVRLHRLIKEQETVWKRGAVFHKGSNTKAEVIEHFRDKKIHIKVQGSQCKELLTIIAYQIDEINETFNFHGKSQVHQLIPCNCRECIKLTVPNFYEREDLERRKRKGKHTIECNVSYDDVSVIRLLEDVFVHDIKNNMEEIHDLIAKGKIENAILLIQDRKERSIQLSRWRQLEKDKDRGTISSHEYDQGCNKVRAAVLRTED